MHDVILLVNAEHTYHLRRVPAAITSTSGLGPADTTPTSIYTIINYFVY